MINWQKRSYTKEQFINAWQSSPTIRQVGLKLGLYMTGDAYRIVESAADDLNLTTTHMKTWGLNTTNNRNRSTASELDKILVKNSTYSNTSFLKKRLIESGLLKNECHLCYINTWCDEPLVLRLDHINGIGEDNEITNLRLLCPNCDSQTPTYKGRNKGH